MIAWIKRLLGPKAVSSPILTQTPVWYWRIDCAGAGFCQHCREPIGPGQDIWVYDFHPEGLARLDNPRCCSKPCATESAKLQSEGII